MLSLLTTLALATPPPIVGGSDVPDGRWAEVAAVYERGDVGCTGVLVAPSLVLTAGHCTSSAVEAVYLGGNDLSDLGEGEWLEVVETVPYPEYWDSYDVGLLVLATPSAVTPPEVASGCALEELVDGAQGQIVGYGATDVYGTRYTDHLQEAPVTIHDADCDDLDRGCEGTISPGGELVAGGGGTDTCYRDSGGPLFLWTSYGVPALAGITSRGADAEGAPCDTGGIYVRVDAVVDWIEDSAGVSLREPTCEPAVNRAPEPHAEPIVVAPGTSGATTVEPRDPDVYDSHTFTLVRSPVLGEAQVGSTGVVTFTADEDAKGLDSLEVRVDDGELSATVEVELHIVTELPDSGEPEDTGAPEDPGAVCGCGSARRTGAGSWVLLAVVVGCRRRPRPKERERRCWLPCVAGAARWGSPRRPRTPDSFWPPDNS